MGVKTALRDASMSLAGHIRPYIDRETRAVLQRSDEMARSIGPGGLSASNFWNRLGQTHLRHLAANGVRNLKSTVNHQYFGWIVDRPEHPQIKTLEAMHPEVASRTAPTLQGGALTFGKPNFQSRKARTSYAKFVELLWHHANSQRCSPPRLNEPDVGNPLTIDVDGMIVSQDTANSLREFDRVSPYLVDGEVSAEVGAGYGRLAFAALTLRPVRYWIFDIPPALAVAEWYLSRTLREKKLFRWRPFDQWSSVSREVEEADIAIFSIDQLRLVPDRTISTFSAISSLHEMTRATCTEVVRLMGLKARNAIYTKNWIEWRNLDDRMRFSSSELDPPKGWRTVFDRTDDVIADFNEKLFVRSG